MDDRKIVILEKLRSVPTISVEGSLSSIYLGEITDDSIELIVNEDPDVSIISSLMRVFPAELSKKIKIRFSPIIGTKSIPIYRPGYFLLPETSKHTMELGTYIKPLKPRADRFNFKSFDEMWNAWGSKHLQSGICLSNIYPGKHFVIWYIDKETTITINNRDMTDQLPLVVKEIQTTLSEDTCLIGTVTAYDCEGKTIKSAEIKINSCNFLNNKVLNNESFTEEQENSLVFHVEDIPYHKIPYHWDQLRTRIAYLSALELNGRFLKFNKPELASSIGSLQKKVPLHTNRILLRSLLMPYPIATGNTAKSSFVATLTLHDDVDLNINLKMCPYKEDDLICLQDSTCELLTQYICMYKRPEYYGLNNNAFKHVNPTLSRSNMSNIEELSHMESVSGFTVEELAEALRINGIMLAPGLWNGIWYSPLEIKKMWNKYKDRLKKMLMKVEHSVDPEYRNKEVGGHEKVSWNDQLKAITYSANVDDPDAISDVKRGKFRATSLKLKMNKIFDHGIPKAVDIEPIDNSLVRDPACKSCRITYFQDLSEDGNEFDYYGVSPLEEEELSDDCKCPFYVIKEEEYANLAVIKIDEDHYGSRAPVAEEWNFSSEEYDIDQLRSASAIFIGDPDVKTSYKLPHHKPDGVVVWVGVERALMTLQGFLGAEAIPGAIKVEAYDHLKGHMIQYNSEVSGLNERFKDLEEIVAAVNAVDDDFDNLDTENVINMSKCFYCNDEVEDLSAHLKECEVLKKHFTELSQDDDSDTSDQDDTGTEADTGDAQGDTSDSDADEGTETEVTVPQGIELPINIKITTTFEQPPQVKVETETETQDDEEGDDTDDSDDTDQSDGDDVDGEADDQEGTQDDTSTDDEGGEGDSQDTGEGGTTQKTVDEIVEEVASDLDLLADLIAESERLRGKWE